MRIGGLASGMDIDSMVRDLMRAERMSVDRLFQKRQIIEWQREGFRSINSALIDFRNTLFNMKLQSSYSAKKAVSADETAFSVTATAGAAQGINRLSIEQLAKAASLTSGDVVTGAGSGSTTMQTLGMLATDNGFLTIGGEKGTATIEVKPTDTIDNLVAAVNAQSGVTGVSLNYDANLDSFFFVSTTTGTNAKVDLQSAPLASGKNLITDIMKFTSTGLVSGEITRASGTPAFTKTTDFIDNSLLTTQTLRINDGTKDYDFKINSTTTVGQLLTAINSSELGKAGVSAYLENGRIVFSAASTGKTLSFSNPAENTADVVTKLGLNGTVTETPASFTQSVKNGVNAIVKFNDVTGEYASNSFSVNGLIINAKKAQPGVEIAITVTGDIDAVFNTIKSFVDKYNETIDKINTKLVEPKYRDFLPLTEDQKEQMSDDDIERWEEKSKSGLLRNDSILSGIVIGFRGALYREVSGLPAGALKQLTEIGITTGNYSEKGKLYINEGKLKDAIANNPDQVMSLFTANDGNSATDAGDGLAVRLYDQAVSYMGQIKDKAGSFIAKDDSVLGKSFGQLSDKITSYNQRLIDIENRYYRQFAAMEKAINQMNSQSGWLSSMFS